MKKKLFSVIVVLFSVFGFLPVVNAANLSVWASGTNITKGNTVTVTVKASGLAGKFSVTSSNSSVLSGGTNSVWLENQTVTYKFTAHSIGTATIKVTPIDVADSNGNVFSSSKTITINVVKPREKSTNNNLKGLSVDGYTITPSFNKNTLEYTVNLESDVEKIKINATKEDKYASVSGTGEKEVGEGTNKFEIIVTSETGVKKTYILNAVVQDSNPITKNIDGTDYTIIKRASSLKAPDNFIETTVTINEFEIPAFYNEITKITLIGLKDETGNSYLFKYNQETDALEKYEALTSDSMTVIFGNENKTIENFDKTTVTISGIEYDAYQYKDNKDYILIYGTILETGKDGWYLYNIKENSIQTYMGDNTTALKEEFNNTLDEYKIVILALAGLSLLLLVIIIIQITSKNKLKQKYLKKIQLMKEELETNKIESLGSKKNNKSKKVKEA